MIRIDRSSDSLDDTAAIAGDLALVLRRGDVVRLVGPMGAGKTTLVGALAVAMGIDRSLVSSPTFVLVNVYPGVDARPDLVHVDAFRLGDDSELDALGWDRLVPEHGSPGDAIVVIEWPERIDARLPAEVATVEIVPTGESSRLLRFELPDSWADRVGDLGRTV